MLDCAHGLAFFIGLLRVERCLFMAGSNNKDDIFFFLKDLKEDIREIDTKLSNIIARDAAREESVSNLDNDIKFLTKIVITGNGQPSLISQLEGVRRDISETRIKLEAASARPPAPHDKAKEEHNVTLERVKLGAKIIAFLTVIVTEASGALYQMIHSLMT